MRDVEKQREAKRRYAARNVEKRREKHREASRRWRAKNLEETRRKQREAARRWRAAHPEEHREAQRRQQAKIANTPGKRRDYNLKGLYGKSNAQYEADLAAQGGICAVCGEIKDKPLHYDHDHRCCPKSKTCGKCLRGLLCSDCNSGLGFFRDDIETLKQAITYLEKY